MLDAKSMFARRNVKSCDCCIGILFNAEEREQERSIGMFDVTRKHWEDALTIERNRGSDQLLRRHEMKVARPVGLTTNDFDRAILQAAGRLFPAARCHKDDECDD